MENKPKGKGQWIKALPSNEFELLKYSH